MTPLGHAGGGDTGRISGPVVVVGSAAAIGGIIVRESHRTGATVRLLDGFATDVSGTLDDAVQQLGVLHALVVADSVTPRDPLRSRTSPSTPGTRAFDVPLSGR